MKQYLLIALLLCLVLVSDCFIVQTNRTILPSQVSNGSFRVTSSLPVSSNEIIVGGYLFSQVIMDSVNYTAKGIYDMFLASIDRSTNQYNWIDIIGGYGSDLLSSFAIDSNNDFVIAGILQQGTSDYGGGNLTTSNTNIVLIKLNSNRTFKWSYLIGTGIVDEVSEVAVDSNDNIIIGGYHYAASDWGGGNLSASGNNNNWAIGKYNSSGHHLWSRSYGNTGGDSIKGIAVLSNDNILAVGFFQYNITINGTIINSQGLQDALIVHFDSSGTVVWYQVIGTAANDAAFGADVDTFNNIYVTGITLPYAWLNKYSSNSTLLWSRSFTGGYNPVPNTVSVGSDNSIIIAGTYSGNFSIDGITVPNSPPAPYPNTALGASFALNFNSSGSAVWGTGFTNGTVSSVLACTFPGALNHAFMVNYDAPITDINGVRCPKTGSAGSSTAVVAFLTDASPSPTPSPSPSTTPSVTPSVTPTPSISPAVTQSTASVTPSISKAPSASKTPSSDSESSGGGLPLEIIIPVVVGGSCCIAAGIVAGVFLKRRKDKKQLDVVEMS